jgi:hypothetical protein
VEGGERVKRVGPVERVNNRVNQIGAKEAREGEE